MRTDIRTLLERSRTIAVVGLGAGPATTARAVPTGDHCIGVAAVHQIREER